MIGDILSATIPDKTTLARVDDGWILEVEIDGFATGMAVDFGSGYGVDLQDADVASASITVSVVSEGYNASGVLGTVNRTLIARKVIRKVYPNQAQEEQATTAGGARIYLALDDYVYDDDKNGGTGTSGTDPTVTIAAAAFRNDGGSSETSASATALAVTNNSTADYPQAIGQWDHYVGAMPADRIKGNWMLACNAYHKHGIAAIKLLADGVTSLTNLSTFVTSQTLNQRTATGLYLGAYQSQFGPLTFFIQGETINCNFEIYPVVGDADSVLDTSSFTTASEEIRGYNQVPIICDKDDALDVIKYVDSVSGSDSNNGDTTGTAYATVGKAVKNGNIAYLIVPDRILVVFVAKLWLYRFGGPAGCFSELWRILEEQVVMGLIGQEPVCAVGIEASS